MLRESGLDLDQADRFYVAGAFGKLNPDVKNFYDFTTDDLIVENYQTWPQIKNIPIAI